jgi:hypothetical protein
MFGQLCVLPEPLPGLGVVGAGVDGDAPVDGDALVDGPTSGDALGDGEAAACATIVPNPPARPMPAATTILAAEPRNHPRLLIAGSPPWRQYDGQSPPDRAWERLPFRTMTNW